MKVSARRTARNACISIPYILTYCAILGSSFRLILLIVCSRSRQEKGYVLDIQGIRCSTKAALPQRRAVSLHVSTSFNMYRFHVLPLECLNGESFPCSP